MKAAVKGMGSFALRFVRRLNRSLSQFWRLDWCRLYQQFFVLGLLVQLLLLHPLVFENTL